MTKRLRQNIKLFIAPGIKGYLDCEYTPHIIDTYTGRKLDYNNIDDKIYIYTRQVKEWFLNRATRYLRGNKNGFIVLMVATSYIEGVEQYRKGRSSNGNSRQFFVDGITRIFGITNGREHTLDNLYHQVRCGLFHNGMTGGQVVISKKFTIPINLDTPDMIEINPELFLEAIKIDFRHYLHKLKYDTQLRDRFNNMFIVN